MRLSKVVRSIALAVAMLLVPAVACANVKEPKGFDKKVYDSSFALYGSSAMAGVQDRFLCTVTAYQKVEGGYLLIGAGHCTGANVELPPDLTFAVRTDLGATRYPVVLLKSVMAEPLDYAVYFLPTTAKYPMVALGNESKDRIKDKTVDVNFSLGVAKIVSYGIISSVVISKPGAHEDITGFFLVTQFDSHGASGSSVVSEKTHKVIGLVIAGWDGETMPSVVEPISSVEKELGDIPARLAKARTLPIPVTVITAPPATQDPDDEDAPFGFWAAQHGGRHQGGARGGRPNEGRGRGEGRGDGRNLGRDDHRRIDRHQDVRERGGHREIFFGGFWFNCGPVEWPLWVFTDDVYVVMVGGNEYIMYDYNDPYDEVFVYVVE